jgi:hypothetical protein
MLGDISWTQLAAPPFDFDKEELPVDLNYGANLLDYAQVSLGYREGLSD